MSAVLTEVTHANDSYSAHFDKGHLALPPARHFAILTCMDARLDPRQCAGLSEGDAHVIRIAGRRTSDNAIRSLVISHKLLGAQEFFVIHHTNCGMELFTNEIISDNLKRSLDTATIDQNGWHDHGSSAGSIACEHIVWLTFSDNARSVAEDVARFRNHPLVPGYISIHGFIYDVTSGRLVSVLEATAAGAVRKRPSELMTLPACQVGFTRSGTRRPRQANPLAPDCRQSFARSRRLGPRGAGVNSGI
jgi:carbonic anhydrase